MFFVVVLTGSAIVMMVVGQTLAAFLPIVLVVAMSLSSIRSYEVKRQAIFVRRLLWTTRLERKGLRAASVDRDAVHHVLKTWGNGGAFSYTGGFRSKRLGRFRAYATDWSRAVVLDFGDRKIVVTPDDPERFVEALQ